MALIVLAGCGGSSGYGGGDSSAGSEETGANTVAIKDYVYAPADLTVAKGTTVEFTNEDSTNHTATAAGAGALDTGTIAAGKSKSVTLETPGTFRYYCVFHPFMKGTITVEG